jgi:hypothetical protein
MLTGTTTGIQARKFPAPRAGFAAGNARRQRLSVPFVAGHFL